MVMDSEVGVGCERHFRGSQLEFAVQLEQVPELSPQFDDRRDASLPRFLAQTNALPRKGAKEEQQRGADHRFPSCPAQVSPRARSARLFNHFVRAGQCRRHGQAERSGDLEIDDNLEFGRLLDRQVGRLGALEYLV